MNQTKQRDANVMDNSRKSILARGCDPCASAEAARAIPQLIGNPEYVPTTTDEDFIEKLRSRTWSVLFFAPGACRYSAASQQIPGGNSQTEGWSLEQYRGLVREHQGAEARIVETPDEGESVHLLKEALDKAPESN